MRSNESFSKDAEMAHGIKFFYPVALVAQNKVEYRESFVAKLKPIK